MQEPYKGLRPYEEQDRDNFFGREHEKWILLDKILTHPLTFLFAASGVGKSSLLQAAIIPELKSPTRVDRHALDVFYWREWAGEAPLQDLQEGLLEQFKQQGRLTAEYQEEGELSLREFLELFGAFTTEPFVVILDQFEEFFNYHKAFPQRFRTMVEQLVEAFYDRTLPLVFVIAMREDFALELSALKDHLPTFLIDNFYRLEKLGLAEAQQAILAPLEKFGFQYEEGLLEQLIKDLTSSEQVEQVGQQVLIETAEVIAPPHLQIVCQQLWNLDRQHPQHLITRKTYDSQGQTQGLVNQHVESHLRKFSVKERRLASRSFDLLVSKRGTKIARTLEDLAQIIRVNPHTLEQVLDQLDRARILRRQDRQKKVGYELYHDMFAKSVYDWNVYYKMRQRMYRGGVILLVGSLLVVGNNFISNAINYHIRLSLKAKVSDDIEVYQGRQGSWNLFGQQKFLYETNFRRDNIEADKLFQQKHLDQLVDLHSNLIGDFPLLERLQAYREAGQWTEMQCLAKNGISVANLSIAEKFITDLQYSKSIKEFYLLTELLEKILDRSFQKSLKTALENMSAPPSVWSKLLKSSSTTLSHLALLVLGELGDTRVTSGQLIPLLQDQNSLWRAIEILKNLGDRQAIIPLIALLKDSDWNVRDAATQALDVLGVPEPLIPLIALLKDSGGNVLSSATQALSALGTPEALLSLIASLKDPRSEVRRSVRGSLLKVPEDLPALIASLKDPDSEVRLRAAERSVEELGTLEAPEVLPALIALLKDPNSVVRIHVAQMLSNMGFPEALPSLRTLLKDSEPFVRMRAAIELSTLGTPEDLPSLIALLKDPDSNARNMVARSLGALRFPEALPSLIALFKDSDSSVRTNVAEALGLLGALEVLPSLSALLKDSDSSVRTSVAEALGLLGSPEALPSLIALLKNSEGIVRKRAAQALGFLGSPEAIPPLIALLKDPDSYVRGMAAQALGLLGSPEAIPPLITLLKDPNSDMFDRVVQALGLLGFPEAIPSLIALLKDPKLSVRTRALRALILLRAPEALPSSIALLKSSELSVHDKVTVVLYQMLGNFKEKTMLDHLIPSLKSSDWDVRLDIIDALGKLGYQEGAAPLYPFLQDHIPSVHLHAALALVALGQTQAVDALITLLAHQPVTLSSSPVAEPAIVWSSLVKKLVDQPLKIKFAALKLFEDVSDQLIAPFLVHLAPLLKETDMNFHHRLAVLFLDRVTDQADRFPLLQSLLHDESLSIRLKAFRTLGKFRTQEAAETVLKADILKEHEKKEWTDRLILDKIILLGNIGQTVGLEFLKTQLQQLERDKTDWRAQWNKDVFGVPTVACETKVEIQEPKLLWAHQHWEFPLAYAITQLDLEEGLKLLGHPFAKVREGAWSALARYGDTRILERLVTLRENEHLGNKTPIIHYAAFRAIDRLLGRLELTGTEEDFERLRKLKGTVKEEAILDRIEWTMGWLAYHLEFMRQRKSGGK